MKRAGVRRVRSERESDRDEQRGRPGVEAKKFHPRLAPDPGENEGDADTKMDKEQEKNR